MIPCQLTRVLAVLILLTACSERPDIDDRLTSDAAVKKLPELRQEPLPPGVALTADYFQRSYPQLSQEEFQQKWSNAQKSGLMFLRSFVNTWYDELARVRSSGPIGPCFGDPHPDNFGYLLFAGKFEYSYNDWDDSGACPVIFDALRYFTALRIWLHDKPLEGELRRSYISFLNGAPLDDAASRSLEPDPKQVAKRMFKKSVRKAKIKRDSTIVAVSADKAQTLFSALQKSGPACSGCRLLDAAKVLVRGGGSAGLDRYWLLVQMDKSQQLIELKELTEPASQRGPWAQREKLPRAELMQAVWGSQWPDFYGFTRLDGKDFLVRSRLHADLDLDALKPEQKRELLKEQVFLLAQLHRRTLSGSTLLEEWLSRQSEFQAQRYSEALLAAKGSG